MTNRVQSITTDQMREVDLLMIEEFGITLVQMMENAGRALARLARTRFLEADAKGKRVVLLAGPGGNGGGGLVCARNLRNWGALVEVFTAAPRDEFGETPAHQLGILDGLGEPLTVVTGAIDLPDADLIVDALVGYSLAGAPRGVVASLIRAANDHEAPVLALDVPSGVDSSTGDVLEPAVWAKATLTLALPKEGLLEPQALGHVGELYLADIGVPPELYARPSLGLRVRSPFAEEDIVRIN